MNATCLKGIFFFLSCIHKLLIFWFEYVNHKHTHTLSMSICPLIFDIATSIFIKISAKALSLLSQAVSANVSVCVWKWGGWKKQSVEWHACIQHTGKRCFIKPHVENEIYIPFMISAFAHFQHLQSSILYHTYSHTRFSSFCIYIRFEYFYAIALWSSRWWWWWCDGTREVKFLHFKSFEYISKHPPFPALHFLLSTNIMLCVVAIYKGKWWSSLMGYFSNIQIKKKSSWI